MGPIIEIFSGGFDSWWHYNFGFDGLLSPPHLLPYYWNANICLRCIDGHIQTTTE